MYGRNIHRSPEGDKSGATNSDDIGLSGDESTQKDSSGKSTQIDNDSNKLSAEEKQKLWKKGYGDGIGKGERDGAEKALKPIREALNEFGVEYDGDDLPTALRKLAKAKAEDKAKPEELETLSKQLEGERNKAKRLEEQLNMTVAQNEIARALSRFDVVDADDAMALFASRHTVKKNADGEVRVYSPSGELVRNEDQDPATVAYALGKFFEGKKHLLKAGGVNGGGGNSDNLTGNYEDLSAKLKGMNPKEAYAAAAEFERQESNRKK